MNEIKKEKIINTIKYRTVWSYFFTKESYITVLLRSNVDYVSLYRNFQNNINNKISRYGARINSISIITENEKPKKTTNKNIKQLIELFFIMSNVKILLEIIVDGETFEIILE